MSTLTVQKTNANPEGDPTGPLDVWLKFEHADDEEAVAEANTYLEADDSYRVEWYLNSVGLVTRVYFSTYDEAQAWYERENFQDFTVNE